MKLLLLFTLWCTEVVSFMWMQGESKAKLTCSTCGSKPVPQKQLLNTQLSYYFARTALPFPCTGTLRSPLLVGDTFCTACLTFFFSGWQSCVSLGGCSLPLSSGVGCIEVRRNAEVMCWCVGVLMGDLVLSPAYTRVVTKIFRFHSCRSGENASLLSVLCVHALTRQRQQHRHQIRCVIH